MTKTPHVTWLRAFDAAARKSSFSAAADELNLTPAAVSQQIKLLEKNLGVKLFSRLPRGVVLTDIGHAYAQPIRRAFSEIQDATAGLFETNEKRTVRVRASISFALLVLAPQLHFFRQRYPNIEIQLSTVVWSDRFDDEETDVDIRFGLGDWDEQDVRRLGHIFAHVVCHPDYAASLGGERNIRKFAANAVQIVGSEADWKLLSDHFDLDLPPVSGLLKADSSIAALQIIRGGEGAAIVAEIFSRRYIDEGVVVSPFDYRLPLSRSFYLVVRDSVQDRVEVNIFCQWLMERLKTMTPHL